jgi:hypothetical protein
MALRNVWWMQKPRKLNQTEFQYGPAERHWPWNRAPAGVKYGVLEEYMHENAGSTCIIDIYRLKSHSKRCRWSYQKTITRADQIKDNLEIRGFDVEPELTETVV